MDAHQASTLTDEDLADYQGPAVEETEQERQKREAKEKKERLKEFGGSVSLVKLISLASPLEIFIFFFGIICAIIHGTREPLMCVMFGELIDRVSAGINQQDFLDEVSRFAVIITLQGCAVAVFGAVQGSVFPWFPEVQLRKMRPLYFDAALHRDVAWFDTRDVGALIPEITADLDMYAEGFGNKLGASFMSVGGVIFGFGAGIYLVWKLGLVLLLAVPIMGIGGAVMGAAVVDQVNETQGAYAKAASIVSEVLFAVRTVVSFGGEQRELNRYSVETERARKGGVKNAVKMGAGMGYIWLAYFSAMALSFWFGMRLVYDGENVSIGNILSAFFCVLTAGFTIGQIPPGFASLFAARLSMARFFYLLDHEAEIMKRLEDKRKTVGPIESLRLEDVHFAYPARLNVPVLNGISIDIKKGQKVAVVGESGSGKSTVMALLERFYDPLKGKVLVNGEDLKLFAVKSFRAQVGYVGQEPVLFATSIKANIMQGKSDATDKEIQFVCQQAKLDFVSALPAKLDTFVGSGGSQFSGGQKQRIAIARALLKTPSVLFLDEATSALDSKSEQEIQQTIDSIGANNELGMTIVSIAHRLSTVQNSDVIYVLQGGKVAEQGSHAELKSKENGLYRALAAAQEVAGSQEKEGGGPERQTSGGGGHTASACLGSGGPEKSAKELELEEDARVKEIAKTYKVPMGRLFGFMRPERGLFVLGIIAAMVSGCVFPIVGAFILVDAMLAFIQPDREVMKREVEKAAVLFVVMAIVKFVACLLQSACFGVIGEAMTKRCRIAMLTTMFRQEIGFHDNPENTPGKLAKALQVHAYRIKALVIGFGEKADALSCVLFGVTLAFIASWEMAAVMLVSIPVFALSQLLQVAVIMGAAAKESSKGKAAQQVLSDAMGSVRTVQACSCEKDLVRLFSDLLKPPPLLADLWNYGVQGIAFGIANGVMFWVLAGGFWFMGFLIKEGRTDFANGNRAFMGVLYAGLGASMAFMLTSNVANAKVAAHAMFQLLDRKSQIDGLDPDGMTPNENARIGRFEFKEVDFFYPFRPDVQVLKSLSFTIEAGTSVGVVGPSGGGKSTVMSMIQRFYDPQKGQVLIGEERWPLNTLNIRWWRKQVGFVGQEPILFDTTVLANVKYGLEDGEEITPQHLEECKRMANLNFLDSHKAQGWETQVGPKGTRLSGGQKQRVAICRALVRNPPVLLLDEATSALDTQSEQKVQQALEQARMGRTSFAIAHRLSTIQDCNVILVVAEGRIVEQGTHGELMSASGVYSKLQSQAASASE